MISNEREKQIDDRLLAIHHRIAWMADAEARAAWINGLAAKGAFLDEKERLLDEADRLLDEFERSQNA